MQTRNRLLNVTVLLLALSAALCRAQFTAFNDHYSGPGTHANATTWNVYGTTGGAPGSTGPLKDINTGANLPVSINITNLAVGGGTTAGGPNAGSPAYNVFNGYVDWGNGTVNHAIQTSSAQAVGRIFTGLDPAKRYRYTASAVRAGGYTDRWIKISLLGAQSFTSAHTGGCLTNATPGATLAVNEVALSSGDNTVGDYVSWDNIQPAADGSFAVHCTQYTGPVPGGSSGGPYGYSIAAEKLEEFIVTEFGASITNNPQSVTVAELKPAVFSITALGIPRPVIQWYKNGLLLAGATNLSYTNASALLSDNNATYYATASNRVTNVSYVATSTSATLTVTPDTTAPTLVSVFSAGVGAVALSFSEPVRLDTATNFANYFITNIAGIPLSITNIILSPDQTNVTLLTSTQSLGGNYRLVINGVRDLSAASNAIAANTVGAFITADFASGDIGTPGLPGSILSAGGGYNVTAAGTDFGGTSDQFTLAYQQKAGDFDVKVRVAQLGFVDAWSKAALMARETLNANSPFAATVAAPLTTGSFFESRATAGAAAVNSGTFPANYPDMWLRLRRVGNVFSGFASVDGDSWVQLGTVTLAVGPVYLGFAVTSHNASQATTAQFRDYANVAAGAAVISNLKFTTEPLAAAARTTPIVISEIMANPGGTNADLEFIELYNSNPFFEDVSGYKITGEINFTLPPNTIMPGGSFLVLGKSKAGIEAKYGITGVLQYGVTNYTTNVVGGVTNITSSLGNSLNNGGGSIKLLNENGAVLLEVDYSDSKPWPIGADGTGHSLVLARSSYGQNDPQSWQESDRNGGSPGTHEALRAKTGLRAVVINEILAHTDLPRLDYIELYNYSTQAVDISGCYISDSAATNKFRVPSNTFLPARGFIAFDETQLGFRLAHKGEKILLRSPDNMRMLDAVEYEPQENGVSFGRYPDGSSELYRLSSLTPGTNNAAALVDDVVINEIMYAPISELAQDEYIELYNKGTNPVNISGWRFTSGIDFTFPPGTVIATNTYIVVAKNAAHLRQNYNQLNAGNTFGDYDGQLSNNGERVALAKPEIDIVTNVTYVTNQTIITTNSEVETNILYIVVDEVTYKNGGRWGKWSDQGGSSMELVDPRSNHRLAYNWRDSDETTKAPWTLIQFTGILDLGTTQGSSPIDRLEVTMLGDGECLLDDVDVTSNGGATSYLLYGGFEAGMAPWVAQGNHAWSTLENTGRSGNRSLHIRSSGNGDTGGNRIRVALSPALTAGQLITLRGYARWQRGWPELLLRVKGNYLEAAGKLDVPSNLGTPGLPNSRALANAAPAIQGVTHFPVLPQVGDSVVVTALMNDPDGVTNATLFYRVDSSGAFTTRVMNDNGTGADAIAGDGIYSASIDAQTAGTLISFYVEATDGLLATNRFPANANTAEVDGQRHECLVRWGDPTPISSFPVYRMWLCSANVTTYTSRPAVSNQDVDGTMVIGNYRVIYNMGSRYGGSPYHQGQNTSPVSGNVHYQASVPKDDMYLGTDSFNKLHAPGNGAFDDSSVLREQVSYWMMRQLGLPYLNRRYFAMYVNGNRKGGANFLMEDSQRPGGEMIDEFFPNENVGRLYKVQPWFEWDDVNVTGSGAAGFLNVRWCQLTPFLSTNNAHKIAAYRYNYLTRSADFTANDYEPVISLVTAASVPTTSANYWPNFNSIVDTEAWARMFAINHAVGNWDSWGHRNGQNLYAYKPDNGKWKLFMWDFNIVLGNSGSDGPGANLFQSNGSDPSMSALNGYPPFRRAWLRAYKDLSVGPNAIMTRALDQVDARYNAMIASGITPGTVNTTVKQWITDARNAIANTVNPSDSAAFTVSTPTINATTNLITISGSAGLDVVDIRVNGVSYPINWTSVLNWSVTLQVTNATQLDVVGYKRDGTIFGNPGQVTVNFAQPPTAPDPRGFIVFNEIMYNPAATPPDAEYIEFYNSHTNYTFDLSGWRVNGVDYTFPPGSFFPPRSFLVLTKDRVAFNVAYGANILIYGEYSGTLQGNGETLTLLKPGTGGGADIVVDKIRYENTAPWSTSANGTGSSLQLLDPNQENARVGNWFSSFTPASFSPEVIIPARTNDGWRFVKATGTTPGGNVTNLMRLCTYIGEIGSALIDDVMLVPGTNAGVGPNSVINGDFEAPLTNGTYTFTNGTVVPTGWTFGTNYSDSTIVSSLVHDGSGALLEVGTFPGSVLQPSFLRSINQILAPPPLTNAVYTLSFWFWATNSATNLHVRVINSGGLSAMPGNNPTNINITYTASNYFPPTLISPASNTLSPGVVNQRLTTLPPFAPLWLNEVQAENVSGVTDGSGEHEPWVEIYNTSTNTVSLEGLYLSANYTNATNWAFPAGSSIGPTQFLIVFCDGEPGETTGSEYHTSFRLPVASGSISLARLFNGAPQVVDYINYAGLHSDRSYGSYPDGQPFDRQEFFFVTPRGTNDGRSAPLTVFVNEWLASNLGSITDPADGDFDDWFEIYNPTTNTVDLAGYYLTDTATNKTKFLITTNMTHTIPPHGHLLVWADNETGQNLSLGVPRPDLHVNFQLAKGGEALGIYAADGTQIDLVTFGPQTDDVTEGRYPDGTAYITTMPGTASPRAANYLPGGNNTAPSLNAIGNKVLYFGQTLTFTATSSDSDLPAQSLTYSLDAGAPAGATIGNGSGIFSWTPAGVGTSTFNVRVTDSGVPPLSDFETIMVEVLPAPSFTQSVRNGANLELNWGTRAGKKYAVDWTANLNPPAVWTPILTNTAGGNSMSYTNGTTNGVQSFFRIRNIE